MKPKPPWEDSSGVQLLRLYRTDKYPDWKQAVNKGDLQPDWPRVVLLDLTAQQFQEFHQDPLAFTQKYEVFPREQPVSWISPIAMPPSGKGIARATASSRWTLALIHTLQTIVTGAACPQDTTT